MAAAIHKRADPKRQPGWVAACTFKQGQYTVTDDWDRVTCKSCLRYRPA